MNDPLTVSALIPVWNGERYLGAAIESVLAQTVKPMEILVADDGSDDGSAEIARSFPGVRVISLPHGGISRARNALVAEAKGEWLCFLDADDLWAPEKTEKQLTYLKEHPACEIVFCGYRNFTDLPPQELSDRQKKVLSIHVKNSLTCACIKKTVFARCGLFDLNHAYGEDTEWILRLKLRGMDLSDCVQACLYFRRIHTDNITLSHESPGSGAYLSLLANAIRNARKNGE